MNIEISVQKHTTIELLGSVVIEDEELVYDGITFVDIPNSLGKLVGEYFTSLFIFLYIKENYDINNLL